MTLHQQQQVSVIDTIENEIKNNSLSFSTVSPVTDFEKDERICLTSVHLPKENLIFKIHKIINALKEAEPEYYYYPDNSLHMTIKNIRVINDPPHFTSEDISKAETVFAKVIGNHKKFAAYFYRLLLFPNNLALIGTTDPEFDTLFLDLDQELKEAGISDDKQYSNSAYFFSNMTLARFPIITKQFKEKVAEVSKTLIFEPYIVDSVTLLSCNAVLKKRHIIDTWKLT
ncbi:MAG TPA: hypothetical protein VLG12_07975 [Candidatus Saccharimonadales bacterium]|nr:hypothetical protein [Candidatus Saccharimonadales bacterium]